MPSKDTSRITKVEDGKKEVKEVKIKYTITGEPEKENVIIEKEFKISSFIGIEKVYYDNRNNIYNLGEEKEDQPIYKSEISIGGKIFDIYLKYNQGRKSDNRPIHLIITSNETRSSLGFYGDMSKVNIKIKQMIYYSITGNQLPKEAV